MTPIDREIAAALGGTVGSSRRVGGGCIHDARRLDLADGRVVFAKSGGGGNGALLEAEADGLRRLAPHIRTPAVIGSGSAADLRWLALEWLDLGPMDTPSWENLGTQLAALHRVTTDAHGLDRDNFIGATPQENSRCKSWREFYLESRLKPQIRLARANGHDLSEVEILSAVEPILAQHEPAPALLHGDLWSGNVAALPDGTAVVFDPAPYFGDPETDLAMLELFGGPLPAAFFRGYGEVDPDRDRRLPLYHLYHALNHLNLFGSSYRSMVRSCIAGLR